jgi:hypothetical protein
VASRVFHVEHSTTDVVYRAMRSIHRLSLGIGLDWQLIWLERAGSIKRYTEEWPIHGKTQFRQVSDPDR